MDSNVWIADDYDNQLFDGTCLTRLKSSNARCPKGHLFVSPYTCSALFNRTEIIGQGAYGIVYKGKKEDTQQIVAIKRIPFADSTPEGGVPCNVIREISLLRELDHPNVVKLLDIIQSLPGGLYLVFEYVAHDLKTYMDSFQRSDDISERVGLPLATVRSFLRQIVSGVGCCHTYRILHRDLKPHNVSMRESDMIYASAVPKLTPCLTHHSY